MESLKITKKELKKLVKEEVLSELGETPGKVVVKIEGEGDALIRVVSQSIMSTLKSMPGNIALEINGVPQTFIKR